MVLKSAVKDTAIFQSVSADLEHRHGMIDCAMTLSRIGVTPTLCHCLVLTRWCPRPESNRYAPYAGKRRILSPMCLPIPPLGQRQVIFGGATQSRTGLDGFAIRCITDLLSRHLSDKKGKQWLPFLESGAGKESRTLDLNLGKVALYQLSYSRKYADRNLQSKKTGAGKESRTLDLNLGKVALYQLSYSRDSSLKLYTSSQRLL
jgi:hypothetical protein